MLKLTSKPLLTKIHFDVRWPVGMVILDETGNFIAASNDKLEFAQDSLTVEAYVVTYGILLSQTFGCNQIIMS
jgi:hypothetical protein